MPDLTVEQTYKADLAELEKLDTTSWIPAGPADMIPAQAEDLHAMTSSEVSALVMQADELEPHGRP